jgi:hypothetical protein
MAAKEESAVLKYLKKNPSQEALDISFAIDIDESLVKEALAVLSGKGEVESKDVDGRAQWSLAAPKAKPAPAPKAQPEPSLDVGSEPAPRKAAKVVVDSDDDAAPAGGASKGFVLAVGLVVLVLAAGAGFVLGGMQASKATQALAAGEVQAVRDSIGLVKVGLNTRIDNLESQIRDLKAAAEKKPVEAAKPAAKATKKKKR